MTGANGTYLSILLYNDGERSLMLFILIILAIFAIVGNLSQFLAIYLEPSLQTASNIFIISLGCSDLGVGIITLPTVALTVYNRAWVFTDAICKLAGVIDSVMITASMWTLGFTALDRFFLVQSPVCHRNTMNKAVARKTVLFCWSLSIACAILPIFGWSDYSFSQQSMSCAMTFVPGFNKIDKYYFLFYVLVSFPVPLGMIIVCYFLIFRFSVNRKTKGTTISRRSSKIGGGCKPVVLVSHIRTAKITLLLIVFVLACILPTFIIGMVFWFEKIIPFSHQTSKAVIWSLLGNSACNPILYGWFNKHFRSVYKRMFLSLLLREKYSILRRSMLSMRSIQGTPKHSFNNNATDIEVMNIVGSNFSHSLKLIKKYNSKLNREPRGSMPGGMGICSCTQLEISVTTPRRHSIAGGDLYANCTLSLPNTTEKGIQQHRTLSQPNMNDFQVTTFTQHR